MLRIDPHVTPTMYHCATVDSYELDLLQGIEDVVRLGHVQRLTADAMHLERGIVPAGPDDLYVDCTAYGLRCPPVRPVFEPDRITIQQVRYCTPTFNAALIGYVESTRSDVAVQNRLCPPSRYPDAPSDWLQVLASTMTATAAWRHEPDLLQWLESSRLNLLPGIGEHATDQQMAAAIQRYAEQLRPAMHKLRELLVPTHPSAADREAAARTPR